MPWNVMEGDPRCPKAEPWAVVKEGDDSLVACHATKGEAMDQMAALYANEPMMNALPDGREYRVAADLWPAADLELRADGDGMHFEGYAAVFNSDSTPMPFIETIAPGAFTRSLKRDRNIRMFLNHNSDILLATTTAKTLKLAEDEKGLRVEAELPDTTTGRDLSALMRRGDVNSMSFAFAKIDDVWSEDRTRRTLKEVRLFDISPITGWPAYPATSAFVRHLAADIGTEVEPLEAALHILSAPHGRLTPEQHELLQRAINVRTDRPYVGPNLVDWRARLIEKGIAV